MIPSLHQLQLSTSSPSTAAVRKFFVDHGFAIYGSLCWAAVMALFSLERYRPVACPTPESGRLPALLQSSMIKSMTTIYTDADHHKLWPHQGPHNPLLNIFYWLYE